MPLAKSHTDQQIVEGCRSNSRKYQELLYRKYFPECYYMCLRYTKDEETARMIVHDGLLKVYQKIDMYNDSGSLRAWIKRIVFNTLSDHFRKESKYLKLMIFDEVETSDQSTQLDNLYYEDLVSLIDKLDFTQREVFMLYAVEGYAHKDIGQQLGITEGNSKWHLFQARKKLKEMVKAQKLRSHA